MRFFIHSQHGEICDLGIYLQQVEGHTVVVYIEDHNCRRIAEGILEHTTEWWRYIGEGYIWLFDGCSHGDLVEWLREQGEVVVGGTKETDSMENDRQKNQKWFRKLGFDQPVSKNFTDFDEAIAFVEENADQRWILKQEADAPKSLSHMGKLDGSLDLLFHLRDLKKTWTEHEHGPVEFSLMEVVTGTEIAASAFFNGKQFLKNGAGKVVGFLNAEEKAESDGRLGSTTGETGTSFLGVTEDSVLFQSLILREGIEEYLAENDYRGVWDVNAILTDDGRLVALEPTCRFGVPATGYEFCLGMESSTGELLEALAKGINRKIEIYENVGMVIVVTAKPFPLEVDVEDEGTSIGERLWPLEDGEPVEDFSDSHWRRLGLYNFERAQDQETGEWLYRVPTKSGYMLTVTGRGEHVATTRDEILHWIKQSFHLAGAKYRQDIGKRIEEFFEMELEAAQ
jgi:phosphoribosylamine-glycine ligase